MKKMMIALAATVAGLVSVSGSAQAAPWQHANERHFGYERHFGNAWSINARQAQLEMQIRNGVRAGALTRGEASRLRGRLESLERLERTFRRNGLSFAERRVLDARFDALARSIRIQMADNQHRYGNYGRHGRY